MMPILEKMNEMIAARLAAQHERRVSAMEHVMSEIRMRNMTTPEIAVHAGVSTSSSHNLRVTLLKAGLITEIGRERGPRPAMIYGLSSTLAQAEEFFADLRELGPILVDARAGHRRRLKLSATEGISVIREGKSCCIPPTPVHVHRDPFDALFFGPVA